MPVLVTTFDLSQVIATFGPILLQGFAEGDAIVIEKDAADETSPTGADGSIVRVKSQNRKATATVRLGRGSPAAAQFRLWRATTKAPLDQQPFRIKDLAAGLEYISLQSWISNEPSPSFSADAPVEEWEITLAELKTLPLSIV